MHFLTSEEEKVLRHALIESGNPGPCATCFDCFDQALPDDICDRLIERGLMIEWPCSVSSEITHCTITATGRLVLEMTAILKTG